jgi:DNA-binding NtrC family response regulator
VIPAGGLPIPREGVARVAARVLVVDDESIILRAVSRMLECGGHEVLPAKAPLQALEIVRNNPPVHLVISDIEMPEMKGTQLIREVAQLSPHTVALLMTGHINPMDVPHGVRVLNKPFSSRELLSTVQATLSSSLISLAEDGIEK